MNEEEANNEILFENENEINNEGNNQNNNNQNLDDSGNLPINNFQFNEPLILKVSQRDFINIINDIFLSILFIIILVFPFYYSPKYCDLNIYLSMKSLIALNFGFIIKGIITLIVIYYDKKNIVSYKIFLFYIDSLLPISYYVCIYFSYLIYSQSNEKCFKLDTFTVFIFFTIIYIGIISFFQTCFYLISIFIYFFFFLESLINNPNFFYNQFGMDPEMIQNLPTIKADKEHIGNCIICLKNINKGEQILILNCPGRHYFHGECIKSWLKCKVCCPICRNELIF